MVWINSCLKDRPQNLARQEGKGTSDITGSFVQRYIWDQDQGTALQAPLGQDR